ncbi:MAG TPA: hypothetical protein VHY08_11225 [Bacillota bacterium]|nr:hypothetical protein [Bacillota bacterium]
MISFKKLFIWTIPKQLRLKWQVENLNREYQKLFMDAEKNKASADEIERLENEHSFFFRMISDDIEYLFTQKLLNKANRLRVPIPSIYHQVDNKMVETGLWERVGDGRCYLTQNGITKLRDDIRSEISWRQGCREHWLKWIPALTGLIGTIIGLLAIIKK